jgi:hypothetical protein
MEPLPALNQLMFKGTHNSYQCKDGTNPIMNHPPNVQIDDFGVWGVELDVGTKWESENLTAVMGHNGPGDGTCSDWGGENLIAYLVAIRDTLAMSYRPILIFLELKHGDDWIDLDPLDECDDRAQKFGLAFRAIEQVFPEKVVQLYEFVDEHNGEYPTVQEMVGKVILYYPTPEFTPDNPDAACQGRPPFKGTLGGKHFDECTSREGIHSEQSQVFRVDQYQADWTFEYGVPPNPLIVDSTAQPPYPAPPAEGDRWDCDNGDVSHGEIIGEQGTGCFPYKTVGKAITRAEGTTPNGFRESSRAGFGWTVLIRPGIYAESLKIDIPLTLKKDDRYDGMVVIAGQQGRMVRSLWITFHTNDENKDGDTGLLVEIKSQDGRVLARFQQSRNKEYRDGFTHTEQLQLFGPVFETDMANASLSMNISPNGNDTWRFDWKLDGTWSDGTPFSEAQSGLELDEDRRHFEKALGI